MTTDAPAPRHRAPPRSGPRVAGSPPVAEVRRGSIIIQRRLVRERASPIAPLARQTPQPAAAEVHAVLQRRPMTTFDNGLAAPTGLAAFSRCSEVNQRNWTAGLAV